MAHKRFNQILRSRPTVLYTLFILSFNAAAHNPDHEVLQNIECYKLQIYLTEDSSNKTRNYMTWNDIESYTSLDLQKNQTHYGLYCYKIQDKNKSDNFTVSLNLEEEPWNNNAMKLFQMELYEQFFKQLGNNYLMEKLLSHGTTCFSANITQTNTNTIDITVKDTLIRGHDYFRHLSFDKIYKTQSSSFSDKTVCIISSSINKIISCLEKKINISINGKVINRKNEKNVCLPLLPTAQVEKPLYFIITIMYSISICILLFIILLALFVNKLRQSPKNRLLCLTIASIIERSMLILLLHAKWEVKCCFIIYFLHRYALLAMNTWMLIIGLDLFLISRCKPSSIKLPTTEEDYARKDHSKFMKYNLIAWSSPIIIPIIDIIISTTISDDNPFHYRLLQDSCLIWNRISVRVYYSPFILLVWVFNCIFLVLTMLNYSALLRKIQNNEMNNVEVNHKAKGYFYMVLKLMILLGLMWIFDTVGDLTESTVMQIIGYIINTIQAFFMFFIFICSKDILLEIKLMFCRLAVR